MFIYICIMYMHMKYVVCHVWWNMENDILKSQDLYYLIGWRRFIGCIGHFLQMSLQLQVKLAKNDLYHYESYESSPPCTLLYELTAALTFVNMQYISRRKVLRALYMQYAMWFDGSTDFWEIFRNTFTFHVKHCTYCARGTFL